MTLFATLLLAAVLIGNSAGQLLFKAAALRATGGKGLGHYWWDLAVQPLLWLGVVVYVAEFFLWLAFLSVVPLWQGVMVASIDILMVMVAARIFFGEAITPPRVAAISLIAIGVGLVGWGGGGA